jgi:hypothetical protein
VLTTIMKIFELQIQLLCREKKILHQFELLGGVNLTSQDLVEGLKWTKWIVQESKMDFSFIVCFKRCKANFNTLLSNLIKYVECIVASPILGR